MAQERSGKQLNAYVSQTLFEQIENRAKRANFTKSTYTRLILERWEDAGFPAVMAADYSQVDPEFSRKKTGGLRGVSLSGAPRGS